MSVSVNVVTVRLRAAAVFDHVDLEEAWRRVAPVCKRAYRNAAPDGRAYASAASSLPVDMRTRIGEDAINGRGADLQDLGLDY